MDDMEYEEREAQLVKEVTEWIAVVEKLKSQLSEATEDAVNLKVKIAVEMDKYIEAVEQHNKKEYELRDYKAKVREVLGRIGNQRYCTECGKRMKEHHYCDACKQSVSVAEDGITYYAQLEIFEELGFVKEERL